MTTATTALVRARVIAGRRSPSRKMRARRTAPATALVTALARVRATRTMAMMTVRAAITRTVMAANIVKLILCKDVST